MGNIIHRRIKDELRSSRLQFSKAKPQQLCRYTVNIFTSPRKSKQYNTACNYVYSKHFICIVSISVLKAIENINNNNYSVCQLRDTLISSHNIKLMWVCDIGIIGNEMADTNAKNVTYLPNIIENIFFAKYIKSVATKIAIECKKVEWSSYNFYKTLNPTSPKQYCPM